MTTYDANGVEKILFKTTKDGNDCDHYLKGNPVSLVCTNINSIMGG